MRVPTRRPLTTMELIIAAGLSQGLRHAVIAKSNNITVYTLRGYVKSAAAKIPGTLPASARVIAWYRGATPTVLGVPPL